MVHEGICPNCGIAYAKWKSPQNAPPPQNFTVRSSQSTFAKLISYLLTPPKQNDPISFWARAVTLALFALWGGYFIIGGVDWQRIGGSFLHNVNLPFHEFGHVLFSPFGNFMMILGGSLFQIMMPLIAMVSFSWQMRDNFAAAIMLWWAGQNFIDVAPYIADAEYRSLPLIRGLSDEYHDWGNLLTQLNCVSSAITIANISFVIGSFLIVLSLIWGFVLLNKIKKELD